jgi:hypothetical protein
VISKYHTLTKHLEKEKLKGNKQKVTEIESAIEELGGLNAYQRASLNGGSLEKGYLIVNVAGAELEDG